MTDQFMTAQARRFLGRIQLVLLLTALIFLLVGSLRLALEVLDGFKTILAEYANLDIFNTPSLVLGLACLGVGYYALYAFAAVGAKEPPALFALRSSFALNLALLIALTIWLLSVDWRVALGLALFAALTAYWLYWVWRGVERLNLWQAIGVRLRKQTSPPWLLYFLGLSGLFILIALGLIHAILSERIELPPSPPAAGRLLYVANFDNADFMDEWNLPRGQEEALIQDGKLILTQNARQFDRAFYALLEDRKFSDFDLRVTTRQISGTDDNTYGVIFRWRDLQNYYLFEISGDGWTRLSKVQNGAAEEITDWTPTPIVQQGATENEIRIVAQGDTFTFYVNQQLIELCTRGEYNTAMVLADGTCFTNEWQRSYQDSSFRQGRVGLSAGTSKNSDLSEAVVIGFDRLVIVGPQ